uniref:Expansin n=1 Tax=Arundo donax TaxID=35708 RepID=A0A0A9FLR2_ARUDO
MGVADDAGGWCNFPREHLELSEAAFVRVAKAKADIVPVQFRRYCNLSVTCLILNCSLFSSFSSFLFLYEKYNMRENCPSLLEIPVIK